MDERKKLIELIEKARKAMNKEEFSCDLARNSFIAEYLIANGVTVQEHGWIKIYAGSMYPYSCSKCGNCHARMVKFCECCGTKLDLPQPPKGE